MTLDARKHYPHSGTVEWIGVRPGKGLPMRVVQTVEADIDEGLIGDRFQGGRGAPRQVTLMQQEHLEVVAKLLRKDSVDPSLTRRNILVSGINLTSLKGAEIQIGCAVLQVHSGCPPCGRMERNLGEGGYNAMRGHGGIVATVIESGSISVGDRVTYRKDLNQSNDRT